MAARPKLYRLAAHSLPRAGCSVQTSTGHTLSTGLPVKQGGDDAAPQPVELLLAALMGCKTATAHFVARHAWPRPHNKIESLRFVDVLAERDERGALSLPIHEPAPVAAGLLRVSGTCLVAPSAGANVRDEDVRLLGEQVERRCPVAAMFRAGGCELDIEWVLDSAPR